MARASPNCSSRPWRPRELTSATSSRCVSTGGSSSASSSPAWPPVERTIWPLCWAGRFADADLHVEVSVAPLFEADDAVEHDHFLVTVLAPEIAAATLEGICGRIADCNGNIERIVRLAAYPVHSYEFALAGGDLDQLRRALADEAVRREVDIAVQVGRAASAGQTPDCPRCRLDPPPGRGDRSAGRHLRLRGTGGGPSPSRPWPASSTSSRRCVNGCVCWPG